VSAFRSPATATPFRASIPGSTFLACHFSRLLSASAARSAFWLRCLDRFAPVPAASTPQTRCRFLEQLPGLLRLPPLPLGVFMPLGIKAFNRPRHPAARLPDPPDFRSLPAALNYLTRRGLRITVPGPLRFRRLAVPQTSWNLPHYAPEAAAGQLFLFCSRHFSSKIIWFISI